MTRFGVSLASNLVAKLDEALSELGYANRSKAIGDAVRDFLAQKQVSGSGKLIATISYLYNHHVSDVNSNLVELQHGFEGDITSTMHAHLSHDDCVEVLIVSGLAEKIKNLYGGLSAIRGVKNCKLSILGNTGDEV